MSLHNRPIGGLRSGDSQLVWEIKNAEETSLAGCHGGIDVFRWN